MPSERPQVVALHGFLGGPESFAQVQRAFGLESPSQVHALVLPGHGPAPWGLELETFDAVVDALIERLPGGRCVLCGYSLGGRLALAMAARAPDRVARVLAIGAHLGLSSTTLRAERRVWEEAQVARLQQQGLAAFVTSWASMPLFASQRDLPVELLAAQERTRLSHVPRGLAWALTVLGTASMPELLPRLLACDVPISLMAGERDQPYVASLSSAAAELGCEIQIVPGVGHNVVLERPAAVARSLVSAVRAADDARTAQRRSAREGHA